jgi:hypothetical protein
MAGKSSLPVDMKREDKKEVIEMVSSITTAAATQPAAAAAPAASDSKKASAQKQQSSGSANTDTVHLSSTAQAQLTAIQAALQEATETPAQTAKEALGGDSQAQQLLAREAQAAEAAKLER